MNTTIVLAGTLDTKREEIAFLRSLIYARGHEVIVADTGILGTPDLHTDISRNEIAIAGGADIDTLQQRGEEAFAQKIMAAGLKKIILSLLKSKKLHGFLANWRWSGLYHSFSYP